MTQDENPHEITVERPTGPRLTMADSASKGQVAAYNAGRAVARVVRARPSAQAFAALIALGVILPAILGLAWISARVDTRYEAFASTVGPFTVDAQGWTVIEPVTGTGTCGGPSANYTGSCIYYVSNAGTDDTTNCKGYPPPVTDTPATTCAKWSFAMTRIRGAKPDWVLFKRGQTFIETARIFFGNGLGGLSTSLPFVMSAYPRAPSTFDDRPIIDTIRAGFSNFTGTVSAAFVSLRFTDSVFDPNSPNYWSSPVQTDDIFLKFLGTARYLLLVEDCEFTSGTGSIGSALSGSTTAQVDVIRRNVFWNDGPPTLAFVDVGNSDLILVEENLLYKDWTNRSSVASSVTITAASPAVITYAFDATVAPENGGLPAFGFSGASPRIGLQGPLPTGLTAITTNCDQSNQCYYLCNISGNTANLSRTYVVGVGCGTLINTSGSACNSGCFSRWNDLSANIFNHNVYIGTGWEHTPYTRFNSVIFRNNITAYASATGSQIRQGGMYYNNLYIRNPIAITGVSWPSDIGYNVITEAINEQTAVNAQGKAFGMDITNYQCAAPAFGFCPQDKIDNPVNPGSSGTRIHHNIMSKTAETGNATGVIRLGAYQFYDLGSGNAGWIGATNGITVDANIVCDWHTSNNKPYTDQGTGNFLLSTNKPDPTTANVDTTCAALGIAAPATVADYYINVLGGPGGSTTFDALDYCKTKLTKISWDDRCMAKAMNAYIRPTYGISNPPDTRTVRMTVQ